MVHKAKRSHKSKAEQKVLNRQRKVKVVGDGRFVQRTKKPQKQGKETKSQLLRVDAGFADFCREKAMTEGSITEVTRKLVHRLRQAELEAMSKVTL